MRRRDVALALISFAAGLGILAFLLSTQGIRPFGRAKPVSPPALLFLLEEDGRSNLFQWSQEEGPEALTDEPVGIWDFQAAPDGSLLLSSQAADGSDDLVLIGNERARTVLLDCLQSQCRGGRLQPGGSLVAYERRSLVEAGGETQVWWLDKSDGRTEPVPAAGLPLEGTAGRFPRWSPDGRYLAYFQPDTRTIVVLDVEGGAPMVWPANLELMGEWSPDGLRLAYSELAFGIRQPHAHEGDAGTVVTHTQPSLYSHVVVSDLDTGETLDLSEGQEVNEGLPAWRPDGRAVAVNRTTTGAGRQIWLITLDDRQSIPLTEEPLVDHSSLAWSPDGRYLAFMRRSADQGALETNKAASVWILEVTTGEMTLVAGGAFSPSWRP